MVSNDLISQNIIKYRLIKKLTQKEFAAMLKIAPSTLSAIECGRKNASMDLLIKMSDTLNISVDDLLDGNLEFIRNINGFDPKNENHISILNMLKSSTIKQKIVLLEILKQYTDIVKK